MISEGTETAPSILLSIDPNIYIRSEDSVSGSETVIAQKQAEYLIRPLLECSNGIIDRNGIMNHIRSVIVDPLVSDGPIPSKWMKFEKLWIMYWSLHSYCILEMDELKEWDLSKAFTYIEEEAYREAPRQIGRVGAFASKSSCESHIIMSYVALCSITIIYGLAHKNHYSDLMTRIVLFINRVKEPISRYIELLRRPDGYMLYENGQVDIRGWYSVIVICKLLRIMPQLNDFKILKKYQHPFGGFANIPIKGVESHAAYTYCALVVHKFISETLGSDHGLDLSATKSWCRRLQCPYLYGFKGRPHKLVDVCYSWWGGAACCLAGVEDDIDWEKLNIYICINQDGGFKDKPDCNPDIYHSCYALSGLCLQNEIRHIYTKSDIYNKGDIYTSNIKSNFPVLDWSLNIVKSIVQVWNNAL